MRLYARDLRDIATHLEALSKISVIVNQFTTISGVVCQVEKIPGDQREPGEYVLTGVSEGKKPGGVTYR
jgi:hypothetical protein